jgi:hypothetical protein
MCLVLKEITIDANYLLSKYPFESCWYPFYEKEEFFQLAKNIELKESDKYFS